MLVQLGDVAAEDVTHVGAGLFASFAKINQTLASVVLAWQRETGAHMSKVNVNGGAVAPGSAGASGARLLTAMLHELERTEGRRGLLTMREPGDQANVTIIERTPGGSR